MISATEWAATVPTDAKPTAKQLADVLSAALTDARATIRDVAAGFSGTVPPPPWPADAELQAALKKADGLYDGFEVIARRTPLATVAPKARDAAKVAGQDVLAKAAALKARAEKSESPADLAAQLGNQALKKGLDLGAQLAGPTVFWVGVGWLAWELYKESRPRGRRARILF